MRRLTDYLAMGELRNLYEGTNVSEVTLETLVERVDNGFKRIDERFDENDKSHVTITNKQDALDKNQKTTNGNLLEMQKFRCRVEGAFWMLKGQWVMGIALAALAASIYFRP